MPIDLPHSPLDHLPAQGPTEASSRPLKVVIVIGSLERGGTEGQIVRLVQALQPRLADCAVVCLGDAGFHAAAVRATGARVLPLGLNQMRPMGALKLMRALRREQPDVVYALLFWGYGLGLPLAAIATPRAGRVAGRRSLPAADPPARAWAAPLRPLADRCSDAIIANSRAVADAWAQSTPRIAPKMHVVHNGVVAAAASARPRNHRLVILCVANLIAYKGHDVLLDALREVVAGGAPPFELRLAGDGPLRTHLTRRIVNDGLSQHVKLLGSVADMREQYAQADILVLPSLSEGLPNAVLEAMEVGVPVVASDVGGVREALGPHAGMAVAPGSPHQLAEALLLLLRDGNLRHDMGREGRERVLADFTVSRMAYETLTILSKAAGRRTGHRLRPSSPA